METTFISAAEAGVILGKTRHRINQLAAQGILTSQRIGNSNVITKESVLALKKSNSPSTKLGSRKRAKKR